MASDLRYSAADLRGLGASLKALADNLSASEVLQTVDESDVGSGDVAHAIDQLRMYWREDLAELAGSLLVLGEHAVQSAESLTCADENLAQEAPQPGPSR